MVARRVLSAALLWACVGVCAPADADVVERVVATVNDEAIFLSDLRKRAVPFLPQLEAAPSEAQRIASLKQLYDELLTMLIDEELISQMARRSQIRVTDAEIQQAMENQRGHFKMSEEQFWAAVKDQGLSREEYLLTIRKQLLRFKIINERVRTRINISEDQVRRSYEKRAREQGSRLRFRLSHVIVDIDGVGSATDVAEARARAEKMRATLSADNFEAQIDKHSGGDLGWVSQGDLPAELEEALLTLEPGEISDPVRGGAMFHMFLMHERETGSGLAPYEEMRDPIFRELLDTAMRRQEQVFLEELRRKAAVRRLL